MLIHLLARLLVVELLTEHPGLLLTGLLMLCWLSLESVLLGGLAAFSLLLNRDLLAVVGAAVLLAEFVFKLKLKRKCLE